MTRSRRCAPALAARLALKWPNDLLLDGAKFAGILIEGEGDAAAAVAVGIGVNCRHHPAATDYPGDRSCGGGRRRRAEALFSALSVAMVQRLRAMERGRASPRSAPTGSRAPPASARASACGSADARSDRPLRDARRGGPAGAAAAATAARETIAAGEVVRPSSRRPATAVASAMTHGRGSSDELVFAPLGGVGEIGMNLSLYGLGREGARKWIVVDLGVAFAGDDLPGIDLILPDIRFLVEERRNLARPRAHPRARGPFRRACSTCGRG